MVNPNVIPAPAEDGSASGGKAGIKLGPRFRGGDILDYICAAWLIAVLALYLILVVLPKLAGLGL